MSHKRHKHNTKKKRARKQTTSKRALPFLLISLLFVLGILGYIVSGVIIRNHYVATTTAQIKAWYVSKKPEAVTVTKNNKQAPLPEEEPIQFEFYSTLENSDELIALDQANATASESLRQHASAGAKLTTKDKKKL